MTDAEILSENAERVMGHKIKGVEASYNRSDYREQKADALEKLATRIDTILNPPAGDNVGSNVVTFNKAAK